MIHSSRDVPGLTEATEFYMAELFGFDPVEWLSIPDNLALTDDSGNWSLFEKGADGVYTGHYFFVIRGKAALTLAKEMLDFIDKETDIKVLRGLTPLTKLGARWMSRQLGFNSHGVVHTVNGPCELFIKMKES